MAYYFMIVRNQDTKGWHDSPPKRAFKASVSPYFVRRPHDSLQPLAFPASPRGVPVVYSGHSNGSPPRTFADGLQNFPLHVRPANRAGYAIEGSGQFRLLKTVFRAPVRQ